MLLNKEIVGISRLLFLIKDFMEYLNQIQLTPFAPDNTMIDVYISTKSAYSNFYHWRLRKIIGNENTYLPDIRYGDN